MEKTTSESSGKRKTTQLNINASSFNPTGSSSTSTPATANSFKLNPNAIPEFIPNASSSAPVGVSEVMHEFSGLSTEDQAQLDYQYYPPMPETPQPHPGTAVNDQGFLDPPMNPHVYEIGPTMPLQHHLYAPPLANTLHLPSNQRLIHSFFIDEDLREALAKRSEAIMKSPSQDNEQNIPRKIQTYHGICQLPLPVPPSEKYSSLIAHKMKEYKATSEVDGRVYLLKRVEGFNLLNPDSINAFKSTWALFNHANIITAKEVFTTKAFNDDSVIFVYDYHPNSPSLYVKYLNPSSQPQLQNPVKHANKRYRQKSGSSFNSQLFQSDPTTNNIQLDELGLWSIICQLAAALKLIHGSGLSCRCLDLHNIFETGKNRIRIGNVGISEFLEPNTDLIFLQQKDLFGFGLLILQLACRQLEIMNMPAAMEFIAKTYSPDLHHIITFLLGNPNANKSIDDIISFLAPRMVQQLDLAQKSHDFLENELCKELENDRMARLLIKMGFINERPEYGMDTQWSETGDRYPLKLFRDYVFHQVDAEGNPVIDIAHVIQCLNHLDAGSTERIMLTSRDDRSCLIVSYQDLKRCAEAAFGDLLRPITSTAKSLNRFK